MSPLLNSLQWFPIKLWIKAKVLTLPTRLFMIWLLPPISIFPLTIFHRPLFFCCFLNIPSSLLLQGLWTHYHPCLYNTLPLSICPDEIFLISSRSLIMSSSERSLLANLHENKFSWLSIPSPCFIFFHGTSLITWYCVMYSFAYHLSSILECKLHEGKDSINFIHQYISNA